METMTIDLPPGLRGFVEKQVVEGQYHGPGDYVLRLIQEDQQRHLRKEVESKLREALETPATEWTRQTLEERKACVKQVHSSLSDNAPAL